MWRAWSTRASSKTYGNDREAKGEEGIETGEDEGAQEDGEEVIDLVSSDKLEISNQQVQVTKVIFRKLNSYS